MAGICQEYSFSFLPVVNGYAGFRLPCRSPLCCYATWSSLAVSELQLSAATPLWLHRAASLPSWIEFNCLRSAAVGKAARLSIFWLATACRFVIPLQQVALAQMNKYHHQSGKRQASMKPALITGPILRFFVLMQMWFSYQVHIWEWKFELWIS